MIILYVFSLKVASCSYFSPAMYLSTCFYVFLRGEEIYKLARTEIAFSINCAQRKMKYEHCFGSICREHDSAALSHLRIFRFVSSRTPCLMPMPITISFVRPSPIACQCRSHSVSSGLCCIGSFTFLSLLAHVARACRQVAIGHEQQTGPTGFRARLSKGMALRRIRSTTVHE